MASRGFEHIKSEAELLALYGRKKVAGPPTANRIGAFLSTEEAAEMGLSVTAQPSRSKHGNRRTVREGLVFDSGVEADYWFDVLKVRERIGDITELERQIDYPLYCPVFVKGETEFAIERACEVCSYRADYRWREADGRLVVADKKATDRNTGKKLTTAEYRLKRKWLVLQSGIEILEV